MLNPFKQQWTYMHIMSYRWWVKIAKNLPQRAYSHWCHVPFFTFSWYNIQIFNFSILWKEATAAMTALVYSYIRTRLYMGLCTVQAYWLVYRTRVYASTRGGKQNGSDQCGHSYRHRLHSSGIRRASVQRHGGCTSDLHPAEARARWEPCGDPFCLPPRVLAYTRVRYTSQCTCK